MASDVKLSELDIEGIDQIVSAAAGAIYGVDGFSINEKSDILSTITDNDFYTLTTDEWKAFENEFGMDFEEIQNALFNTTDSIKEEFLDRAEQIMDSSPTSASDFVESFYDLSDIYLGLDNLAHQEGALTNEENNVFNDTVDAMSRMENVDVVDFARDIEKEIEQTSFPENFETMQDLMSDLNQLEDIAGDNPDFQEVKDQIASDFVDKTFETLTDPSTSDQTMDDIKDKLFGSVYLRAESGDVTNDQIKIPLESVERGQTDAPKYFTFKPASLSGDKMVEAIKMVADVTSAEDLWKSELGWEDKILNDPETGEQRFENLASIDTSSNPIADHLFGVLQSDKMTSLDECKEAIVSNWDNGKEYLEKGVENDEKQVTTHEGDSVDTPTEVSEEEKDPTETPTEVSKEGQTTTSEENKDSEVTSEGTGNDSVTTTKDTSKGNVDVPNGTSTNLDESGSNKNGKDSPTSDDSESKKYTVDSEGNPIVEKANHADFTREDIITAIDAGRTDFSGHDLSGLNLSGIDLSGINLSGCNLTGTIFYKSNLEGVNMEGANVSLADFRYSNMERVSLVRAIICYTRFEGKALNEGFFKSNNSLPQGWGTINFAWTEQKTTLFFHNYEPLKLEQIKAENAERPTFPIISKLVDAIKSFGVKVYDLIIKSDPTTKDLVSNDVTNDGKDSVDNEEAKQWEVDKDGKFIDSTSNKDVEKDSDKVGNDVDKGNSDIPTNDDGKKDNVDSGSKKEEQIDSDSKKDTADSGDKKEEQIDSNNKKTDGPISTKDFVEMLKSGVKDFSNVDLSKVDFNKLGQRVDIKDSIEKIVNVVSDKVDRASKTVSGVVKEVVSGVSKTYQSLKDGVEVRAMETNSKDVIVADENGKIVNDEKDQSVENSGVTSEQKQDTETPEDEDVSTEQTNEDTKPEEDGVTSAENDEVDAKQGSDDNVTTEPTQDDSKSEENGVDVESTNGDGKEQVTLEENQKTDEVESKDKEYEVYDTDKPMDVSEEMNASEEDIDAYSHDNNLDSDGFNSEEIDDVDNESYEEDVDWAEAAEAYEDGFSEHEIEYDYEEHDQFIATFDVDNEQDNVEHGQFTATFDVDNEQDNVENDQDQIENESDSITYDDEVH